MYILFKQRESSTVDAGVMSSWTYFLYSRGDARSVLDSLGEVHFKPRGDTIERVLGEELKEYASVPSVTIVINPRPPRTDWDAPPVVTSASSPNGTTPPEAWKDIELATKAVMKATGYEKAEARERITKAFRMLSNLGRKATWDEIATTAIYGRVMDFGGKVVRGCGNGKPDAGGGGVGPQNGGSKAPESIEKSKTDNPK
jgi:hypothetical protein